MADLNLVSISLVFIVVPLFWFLLVYFPFHRGTAGNPVRCYAKNVEGRVKTFAKALPPILILIPGTGTEEIATL
jgi:hypothetical protein